MGEFTYEHLFDVVRRERSREEIQELEEGFYAQANSYIAQQKAHLQSLDALSTEADQLRIQLQNAQRLLKELYDRREKKIMLLALNKARTNSNIIDTQNLLESEKTVFERMVDLLRKYRGAILHASPQAPPPSPAPVTTPASTPKPPTQSPSAAPEPAEEGTKVKILSNVPKFMGAEKQTFGPFEKDQEVSLPDRIAQILVRKGRAELAEQ